jgi:hypothetical protein
MSITVALARDRRAGGRPAGARGHLRASSTRPRDASKNLSSKKLRWHQDFVSLCARGTWLGSGIPRHAAASVAPYIIMAV